MLQESAGRAGRCADLSGASRSSATAPVPANPVSGCLPRGLLNTSRSTGKGQEGDAEEVGGCVRARGARRGARPTAPCPREVSAPRPLRQPLCRWLCPTAGPAPPGRRTGFSLLVGPLCVGWLCREGGPQPGSRGSGAAHLHLEVLSILRQRSAQFLQGHTETVVDFAGHSALPSRR